MHWNAARFFLRSPHCQRESSADRECEAALTHPKVRLIVSHGTRDASLTRAPTAMRVGRGRCKGVVSCIRAQPETLSCRLLYAPKSTQNLAPYLTHNQLVSFGVQRE